MPIEWKMKPTEYATLFVSRILIMKTSAGMYPRRLEKSRNFRYCLRRWARNETVGRDILLRTDDLHLIHDPFRPAEFLRDEQDIADVD